MKITVDEIKNNPDYTLLDRLSYDHVLDFAMDYIRKPNRTMTIYYICLLGFALLLIGALAFGMIVHGRHLLSILKQYLYGLIISFTIIIPMHEIIHGLVYLLLGARKIRFGAELKQFAFYAVADNFVTKRPGFYFLALSPFTFLLLLNLAGFLFVRGVASYTYISILFFHATMCIGDFALLSYYEYHKEKKIYTFDDIKNKTSYFYYRK